VTEKYSVIYSLKSSEANGHRYCGFISVTSHGDTGAQAESPPASLPGRRTKEEDDEARSSHPRGGRERASHCPSKMILATNQIK